MATFSRRPANTLARFEVELSAEDLTRLTALYPELDPADAVIAAIRALALGPDVHAAVGKLGQQQRAIIDRLDHVSRLVDQVGAHVIRAGAEAGLQRNAELLEGLAKLLGSDSEGDAG